MEQSRGEWKERGNRRKDWGFVRWSWRGERDTGNTCACRSGMKRIWSLEKRDRGQGLSCKHTAPVRLIEEYVLWSSHVLDLHTFVTTHFDALKGYLLMEDHTCCLDIQRERLRNRQRPVAVNMAPTAVQAQDCLRGCGERMRVEEGKGLSMRVRGGREHRLQP